MYGVYYTKTVAKFNQYFDNRTKYLITVNAVTIEKQQKQKMVTILVYN
jgi:hypothetical protein